MAKERFWAMPLAKAARRLQRRSDTLPPCSPIDTPMNKFDDSGRLWVPWPVPCDQLYVLDQIHNQNVMSPTNE